MSTAENVFDKSIVEHDDLDCIFGAEEDSKMMDIVESTVDTDDIREEVDTDKIENGDPEYDPTENESTGAEKPDDTAKEDSAIDKEDTVEQDEIIDLALGDTTQPKDPEPCEMRIQDEIEKVTSKVDAFDQASDEMMREAEEDIAAAKDLAAPEGSEPTPEIEKLDNEEGLDGTAETPLAADDAPMEDAQPAPEEAEATPEDLVAELESMISEGAEEELLDDTTKKAEEIEDEEIEAVDDDSDEGAVYTAEEWNEDEEDELMDMVLGD